MFPWCANRRVSAALKGVIQLRRRFQTETVPDDHPRGIFDKRLMRQPLRSKLMLMKLISQSMTQSSMLLKTSGSEWPNHFILKTRPSLRTTAVGTLARPRFGPLRFGGSLWCAQAPGFYLATDAGLTEIISITSPVLGSILRTGDAAPRLPYKKRSAGVARVAETPIPLTRSFRPGREWVFRSS
jgi:hypothetical protein